MSALFVLVFFVVDYLSGTSQSEQSNNLAHTQQREQATNVAKPVATDSHTEEEIPLQLPAGVNPLLRDKPEIQVAWMDRGKNIILKNKPDADSADFRNTFFHRNSNDRPVTCGEVQFSNDGTVTTEFQRVVFVGVHSSHLEQDVTNFDILWDLMCVQVMDN